MANIVDRPVRIRRYFDAKLGAYQITPFPDSAPEAETPLLARTGFITDIEVFANEGRLLALDIGEQELGVQIETVGLDWEHAVANHNNLLIPTNPSKVSDPVAQAAIDALDDKTEGLVAQLNAISAKNAQISSAMQQEAEERREK